MRKQYEVICCKKNKDGRKKSTNNLEKNKLRKEFKEPFIKGDSDFNNQDIKADVENDLKPNVDMLNEEAECKSNIGSDIGETPNKKIKIEDTKEEADCSQKRKSVS